MENNNYKKFPGFPPEPSMNFWSYPKALNGFWHTLNGSEQKVLDYILRHTWGFNKVADEISLTQLETGIKGFDKGTGLSRPTIVEAIKGLVKKGFIKKRGGRKANCYELVKDFNYPSKESLSIASKETLHTIDKVTINNKQYGSSSEELADAYKKGSRRYRPYTKWGEEMRWVERKGQWRWKVILKDGGSWLEFADKESDIKWR